MIVSDISVQGPRLSATVAWEDNDRPPQSIWFDIPEAPPALSAEAFLVACAMPAMRDREKRLRIDAPVDPDLLDSIPAALLWRMEAHGYEYPPPALEAPGKTGVPDKRGLPAAGMLSCGIDSLAMFRLNLQRYHQDHPRRLRLGVVVKGFDAPQQFEATQAAARRIGGCLGIDVISVNTNIQELTKWPHPTRPLSVFWGREWHGSAIASVAHTLTNRASLVSLASSGASLRLIRTQPWGSHPLFDPLFGSSAMPVYHENGAMPRLEKTRVVAEWEEGLRNLLVCTLWTRQVPNCGLCEKCMRTALALTILGRLDGSPFQNVPPTVEILRAVELKNYYEAWYFEELVGPLAAAGRNDLARATQGAVDRYRRRLRMGPMKERAKAFDRRYLGEMAVRTNRFARRILLGPAARS